MVRVFFIYTTVFVFALSCGEEHSGSSGSAATPASAAWLAIESDFLATCATSSCHGFGGNLPLLVDEPSAIANASAIHDRINRLPSEDGFMPREGDYPTEDADVNIKDYFLNLVE